MYYVCMYVYIYLCMYLSIYLSSISIFVIYVSIHLSFSNWRKETVGTSAGLETRTKS